MINRWNAALRLGPYTAVACLALACSGSVDNPPPNVDVPPVIERDTCEDNPLLAGCSDTPDPTEVPEGDPDPSTTPDPSASELELARAAAENVLRANCGQCHGPQLSTAAARAGMNFIDNVDELVTQGKLVPLAADESPVVRRMREGSMPPLGNDGPRPSERDIEVVADFVDNPLFWPEYRPAASCAGQLISFDDLYGTLLSDLRARDDDDQPFTRYITLTNRYNAGACADTLDRDRFAVTKLVNMLSTRASIAVPEPIDDDKLIYRIDIRDYDWDRTVEVNGQQFSDGWEAIVASSPYAVPFVGDQADRLRDDMLTDVAVMNADAMLDVAALGGLYYGLVGVDVNQSLDDFVSITLGINVQDNIDDGEAIRAGTTRSAISREDRVIERHDIGGRQGAYWQSFDFAADDAGNNIFVDPFGFNQGGTESIFTLPNGLLGFIIADENGNIVDESDLLLDTFQDDFVVRTSVSCSNCHAQGFNPVTDEVRSFVEENRIRFQRDQFEAVQEIYLDPADFADVIESDSSLYQQALARAGLPVTGGDPVASGFVRFNLDLDLAGAAGELAVTPEQLRRTLNLLDPRLSVLRELDVERDDFTNTFEESLCVLQSISNNHPDEDRCAALLGN